MEAGKLRPFSRSLQPCGSVWGGFGRNQPLLLVKPWLFSPSIIPSQCSRMAERKGRLCLPLWDVPPQATPLGTEVAPPSGHQLEEAGDEGRLQKKKRWFFSKHGTSLPLTASVARNSLKVVEKHLIPRANPFFLWQFLLQQRQKHMEVWSVHARKAAPITPLSLLNEILESA